MKLTKNIILLLLSICLISACNKTDQTKQDVLRLRTEKMNLDICKSIADSTDLKGWKLVVYTDSTECSACRTSDFPQWNVLLKPFEKRGVATFFIFRPRQINITNFSRLLRAKKQDNKVLVDSIGRFRSQNPQIPDDSRLHSFLVDKNDRVVFVGNPLKSDQIKDLMLRIIDETEQKEK